VTPVREQRVRDLLAACHAVYGADPGDLDSWQVVNDYTDPVKQRKYVHMYFAKSVGCWRHLRQVLAPEPDGPVVSIGAGPCLCILGWFFDRPPAAGQDVIGVDVLGWEEVRNDATHAALVRDVVGDAGIAYHPNRFFPRTHPPQICGLDAEAIAPDQIPPGATVLLPWVMNHVLGAQPHPKRAEVGLWLQAVRTRARRVVVVDLDYKPVGTQKSTHDFWATLTDSLGLARPDPEEGCPVFRFNSRAAEFSTCYDAANAARRTGVRYPHFCRATGLVGDAAGWRYIA
jgi:hypothetical protein